jgi:hypothetical protein
VTLGVCAAAEEGSTIDDDLASKFRIECDDANVVESTMGRTVVCHGAYVDASETMRGDDDVGIALRRGCHVAHVVRRAVFEGLGFTLSAGISTNKLVAKLAATHGKPNGQVSSPPDTTPLYLIDTCIARMNCHSYLNAAIHRPALSGRGFPQRHVEGHGRDSN